jgi:hypothetical protein
MSRKNLLRLATDGSGSGNSSPRLRAPMSFKRSRLSTLSIGRAMGNSQRHLRVHWGGSGGRAQEPLESSPAIAEEGGDAKANEKRHYQDYLDRPSMVDGDRLTIGQSPEASWDEPGDASDADAAEELSELSEQSEATVEAEDKGGHPQAEIALASADGKKLFTAVPNSAQIEGENLAQIERLQAQMDSLHRANKLLRLAMIKTEDI